MLSTLGPPFAFSLWVAARLLLVHGSTIDHHVSSTIHPLVATLREMGSIWNVASRYATLLQRVLDEYHESEHAPADPNGQRVTPSTVRILADMRRTAYDLDFLISRQPRHGNAGVPADGVHAPGIVSNGFAARSGGGSGGGITPAIARTPAPNELEYLDVFDFFNMPRLPAAVPATEVGNNGEHDGRGGTDMRGHMTTLSEMGRNGSSSVGQGSEFNITNFMYDADADWFMRDQNT